MHERDKWPKIVRIVVICLLDNLPEDYKKGRAYLFMKGAELERTGKTGLLREVFLASEAWVSTGKPGQKKLSAPKNDPDRTEALVVYCLNVISKEQKLFMFTIVRDIQGIAREIAPFQDQEEIEAVSNPFLLTFLAGYASVPSPN